MMMVTSEKILRCRRASLFPYVVHSTQYGGILQRVPMPKRKTRKPAWATAAAAVVVVLFMFQVCMMTALPEPVDS